MDPANAPQPESEPTAIATAPAPESTRRGREQATTLRTDAAIETRRIVATIGAEARTTRRRRRRTQAQVAAEMGISRPRYAELERGLGAMAPLDTWVRVGLALDRPLAVSLSREIEPVLLADAGHLTAQEWIIGRALEHGRDPSFELPTRLAPDAPVADACLRDDPKRTLAFLEIWNRLDDLGAASRASDRKVADATTLATIAGGGDDPYRVALGWVLVDTAANRRLVARYPAIMRTRFPGSSVALVRALTYAAPFPATPAIAWFDPRSATLRPLRHRP